jgi:hypothetical protein
MCTADDNDPENDIVVLDEEPDLDLVGLEVRILVKFAHHTANEFDQQAAVFM